MTPARRASFERGVLRPGTIIAVEVVRVEERRKQVQLREASDMPGATFTSRKTGSALGGGSLTAGLDLVSKLYALCDRLDRTLDSGAGSLPAVARYLDQERDALSIVRSVRAQVAHGSIGADDLVKAAVARVGAIAQEVEILAKGA